MRPNNLTVPAPLSPGDGFPQFQRRYGPYWEFWSPKARSDVRITREFGPTDLAYYQWHLLEADPTVAHIEPRVLTIRERVDGKRVARRLWQTIQRVDVMFIVRY